MLSSKFKEKINPPPFSSLGLLGLKYSPGLMVDGWSGRVDDKLRIIYDMCEEDSNGLVDKNDFKVS